MWCHTSTGGIRRAQVEQEPENSHVDMIPAFTVWLFLSVTLQHSTGELTDNRPLDWSLCWSLHIWSVLSVCHVAAWYFLSCFNDDWQCDGSSDWLSDRIRSYRVKRHHPESIPVFFFLFVLWNISSVLLNLWQNLISSVIRSVFWWIMMFTQRWLRVKVFSDFVRCSSGYDSDHEVSSRHLNLQFVHSPPQNHSWNKTEQILEMMFYNIEQTNRWSLLQLAIGFLHKPAELVTSCFKVFFSIKVIQLSVHPNCIC